MTVDQAEWGDPPNLPMRYDWTSIADQLRTRPMQWARVFESDRTSLVTAITSGRIAALSPDLGFEVRTSGNKRGSPRTCTLHMRYNPAKEDGLKAAIRSSRKEQNIAPSRER